MIPRRLGALALATALVTAQACAPAAPQPAIVPSDVRIFTLSIFGMDCEEDPPVVLAELRKEPGVYDAEFDKKRVIVRVRARPSMTAERLLAAIARTPFRAELSDNGGAWVAAPAFPPDADVRIVVTDGSDLPDVDALAVTGKVTVVDFYGDWCKPCRQVDEHMRTVLAARSDVGYRKLNVVDWDSPLSKRYLKNVPELPYVIVFAKSRARLVAISGLHIDRLDDAIAKGGS